MGADENIQKGEENNNEKIDFQKARYKISTKLKAEHILNSRYNEQNFYAHQHEILKKKKDKTTITKTAENNC